MQLRRYCVTVMDNWTPMRFFWTRRAARAWRESIGSHAYLYVWQGKEWREEFTRAPL